MHKLKLFLAPSVPTLALIFFVVSALVCANPNSHAAEISPAAASQAIQELGSAREIFLQDADFGEKFERLMELEQQALQLALDEPLKLGSIGSAILDIYAGSLTGHYVMQTFYGHLETEEAEQYHKALFEHLVEVMHNSGDGSVDSPYSIMTVYDAHAFSRRESESVVGSIYRPQDATKINYLMVTRPVNKELIYRQFSVDHLLDRLTGNVGDLDPAETNPAAQRQANATRIWALIQLFASRKDTAAQAAIGTYLARLKRYDQAVTWLRAASRTTNVLANSVLAQLYWTMANDSEESADKDALRELALENHMHAIALGSADSMYTLATLYINDFYGEENRAAAIPLLKQAGELGHTEALMYLGYLYNIGREVEKNVAQAQLVFAQAAEHKTPQSILNYARFLHGEKSQDANPQLIKWLEELAADDNAEAMVVLGNLHARGVATRQSKRRAIRWYKKAVRAHPMDADIVNEVAWTLTVTDVKGLKRAKFAKQIMDTLMTQDSEARAKPEYLDTWAASLAANGEFEQATVLQNEAIAIATEHSRDDVLDILKEHLEQFKIGESITEAAP